MDYRVIYTSRFSQSTLVVFVVSFLIISFLEKKIIKDKEKIKKN